MKLAQHRKYFIYEIINASFIIIPFTINALSKSTSGKIEFGEILNIYKLAEQAGKLGKKFEWKIWYIVFQGNVQ